MRRVLVFLPDELMGEIDALVGLRGRSAFLVEVVRKEVKRRKLLAFLESREPAWRDENHPELADGAGAWVGKLRAQGDERL